MKYFFRGLALTASLTFFACNTKQGQESTQSIVQEPPTPPVVKDSIHRIKLAFVGDIMGHGSQIKSAALNQGMDSFDYEPSFRYIAPIMKEADLAIGNLEVTLNNKKKYSGYPCFRSPDTLAYFLKEAGFDFLVTANNHSNDNRKRGLINTLDVLDRMQITHTGTFRDSAERAQLYPLIWEKEVDGTTFKLAFLNFTYGTNGIKTQSPTIVNLIDEKEILADIQKAKAAHPDMIIALVHWGHEYHLDEHNSQIEVNKLLWENGVEVVIGAHPHVIEPIKEETLYNSDSTIASPRLVAYSLGNFISNQLRKNTDIGLIFELELVKNSLQNKTNIGEHSYIPVWRHVQKNGGSPFTWTHTTIPSAALQADTNNLIGLSSSELKRMNQTTERMRQHLGKWSSKERIISKDILYKQGKIEKVKVQ